MLARAADWGIHHGSGIRVGGMRKGLSRQEHGFSSLFPGSPRCPRGPVHREMTRRVPPGTSNPLSHLAVLGVSWPIEPRPRNVPIPWLRASLTVSAKTLGHGDSGVKIVGNPGTGLVNFAAEIRHNH